MFLCLSCYSVYDTITSLEQRQRYQDDFCAEYDEYKDLHSRIATITHMFVQLGSKIKSLSPGTKEYKVHTRLDLICFGHKHVKTLIHVTQCWIAVNAKAFVVYCVLYHLDNGRPNIRKVQEVSKGKSNICWHLNCLMC